MHALSTGYQNVQSVCFYVELKMNALLSFSVVLNPGSLTTAPSVMMSHLKTG